MQWTRWRRVSQVTLTGALVTTALLVVACGRSNAPEVPAISEAEASAQEPLIVGTAPPFPPFQFKGESGDLEGFDVDLIQALGQQMNREIDLETVAYREIFPALEKGQIDAAISAIPIPKERSETIDFSRPYLAADLVLAVRQSDSSIASEADLQGKTLGVQLNTVGAVRAVSILGSKIMTFDTATAALEALREGEVDAVLHTQPTILSAMTDGESTNTDSGASEEIRILEQPLERQVYGIALPEDSANTEPLNEALEALAKEGTYAQIYEKWFGTAPPDNP